MARIAQTELERLKEGVSVQRLVEAAGLELKRAGKDLIGRCPFHEDDTASLVVSPVKNLWHCFGCGAAGGPIDWVMKARGVSFRHAVELLRDGVPVVGASSSAAASVVSSADEGVASKPARVRVLPAPVAFDADDAQLLGQVADYYHATLKQSPEALAYLEKRGITGAAAAEAIEVFKLGYANRTLGLRLPEKTRKAGADIRSRLEALGVYRDSGHEHLNGSLIVPLFSKTGAEVVNLYGRKLLDNLRAGTPKHLYLPGSPRRGLFNPAALIPGVSEELIVCEALMDALTFWCAGFRNVTSAYGVEGVTDELIEAIQASGAHGGLKRVLIAFDRDEPGDRGAAKLASVLQELGLECCRVVFPKGMDANEYALKVQPAAKSLGLLIRKAEWMSPDVGQSLRTDPRLANPSGLQAARWEGKGPAPQRECDVAPPVEISDGDVKPSTTAAKEEKATELPSLAASGVAAAEVVAAREAPAPAAMTPAPAVGPEVVMTYGEADQARRWRVRGLPKNLAVGVLKVNVMVSAEGSDSAGRFHVDTLDLYAARARAVFVQQGAAELGIAEGVLKADLGRLLLKLEALQDEAIREALTPKEPTAPRMTQTEEAEALALLESPDLMARIVDDFEACGVVGERTNKLVGYLAAISRLLDRPLAVVIQSSSAAGKSSLMDAVLAFVPEEARTKYSAMTGQSLFYMGQTSLKHRILAIAEEEGASRASYAMKLLQSEGELTIASTGSDPKTGNLITQEYRVEGPTMLMMTTTAIDLDEELLNRCLVLTVDEDREQTRRIHALQREKRTLAGLAKREAKTAILATHQNAQRLLKPLAVVNPYADRLTFLDDRTRTRRDHEKYLTLIDTIALLHQHQRTVKTASVAGRSVEYIEASLADIDKANAIAHEVLGRSLDELPPQTRRVLGVIVEYVRGRIQAGALRREDVRFTRAQLRAASTVGDTQLKVHLARLVELEYLSTHRAERGQGFVYELLFDGDAASGVHLSGLIDVDALKAGNSTHSNTYDERRSGLQDERSALGAPQSAPGRGPVGQRSGAGRASELPANPALVRLAAQVLEEEPQTHTSERNGKAQSYAVPSPYAGIALAAAQAQG